MPSYCCVPSCKTKFVKGADVQFFRFPLKNEELTKQWVRAIDRIDFTPTKGTRICSKHFTEKDYLLRPVARIKRLKSNAVPSVFYLANDTFNASSSLYQRFSREWKLARMQMMQYQEAPYVKEIDVRSILNQQNNEEQQASHECDDKDPTYPQDSLPTNRSDNVIFIKSQPEDDSSIDDDDYVDYDDDRPKITHTAIQTSKSLLRPIVGPLKRKIQSLKRTIERRDRTIRNLRQRLELLTSIKEEILSDDDDDDNNNDDCSEFSDFEGSEEEQNEKIIIKVVK